MNEMVNQREIESACQRYKEHTASKERRMHKALAAGDRGAINQLDELSRYVNRFVQMGRPEFAAELLSEHAEGRVSRVSALERIIEQNELMAASFFARGLATSRAVGRILVRNAAGQIRGYGTGFMISPKLMMTNNHVSISLVLMKTYPWVIDTGKKPSPARTSDVRRSEGMFSTERAVTVNIAVI